MSAYTYVQSVDEVIQYCADPNTYRARIQRWINQGIALVYRQSDTRLFLKNTTITTVSGTQSYALPTDFVRLSYLRESADDYLLTQVEPDFIGDAADSSGRPTDFALTQDGVLLYPTPNAVYTIFERYYKSSTELTTDSQVIPFDPPYDDLPVYYATSRLFMAEDDAEMGSFWYQNFLNLLRQYRSDEGEQSLAGPQQVEGAFVEPTAYPSFTRP